MNYEQPSKKKRYQIEISLRNKVKQKEIVIALGRSESTISHEIRRNKGKIPNRVSIHDRPKCIEEKIRIGD